MAHIDIVGLGPGPARYLTLESRDLLLSEVPVYLRTAVHPTIAELKAWGCVYTSFDALYEQAKNFEKLYQQIIEQVFSEARAHQKIVYAVPGNPMVAESTVSLMLSQCPDDIEIRVVTAVSCLDVIFEALQQDPTDGFSLLDGLSLSLEKLHLNQPLLITQVYSQAVANEVKLILLERLDPEFEITVIRAAGCDDQMIEKIALQELDRLDWIDHLTTVWVPIAPPESQAPLEYLRYVVQRLRDPETGCPWDLKQDHYSLRKYVIEEAYEVITAIEADDPEALAEELGDLLLQVYLQSQVAQDQDNFDLDQVALGIAEKLIYRHPHVFGDLTVADADEVKRNWEVLKAQEKIAKGRSESVLSDLPTAMPSLSLTEKITKKVAHVGFDWPNFEGVLDKIDEEYLELKEAADSQDLKAIFHELGDAIFTLVNLARWFKLDPEDALRQANFRFIRRFQSMERQLQGRSLHDLSPAEWDPLWNQAKLEVG